MITRSNKSRRSRFAAVAAIAGAVASSALAADAPAASGSVFLKSARLSLHGKSTLHPYKSETSRLELRSLVVPGAAVSLDFERLLRPAAVSAIELAIPVAGFKSEKDGLDKNMRKALKAGLHAEIRFRLRSYDVGAPEDGVYPVRVSGALTVAGVERETQLSLAARLTSDGLAVDGEHALLMTDFGIAPPKFMLGTLKTDNKVVIRFSLVFALAEAGTQSSVVSEGGRQ
jgi:polyisoprenoid-binding protein YceI